MSASQSFAISRVRVILTAIVWTLFCSSSATAFASEAVMVIERAEFMVRDGERPLEDDTRWRPVTLPHQWRETDPGITGQGWYRIKFELAELPTTIQAILVANERSQECAFFVNGNYIGGTRDVMARARIGVGLGSPLNFVIPIKLLQAGQNVILVRMRTAAHPFNIQGLGRVTFGEARALRGLTAQHWEWGFYADRSFVAMAVAAGLITLFVWFARRSDRVMLWFGITCLSWALGSIFRFWVRWTEIPPQILAVLAAYTTFGLVVPSVILCLRTVGIKRARLEAALWTYLIIAISYPLWTDITNVVVRNAWDIVNAALLLIGVAVLLYEAPRPLRWSTKLAAAALLTMAVLMFDELARIFEWVDIDSIVVRQFHVPVMLIAIGAAIYERHVHAVWGMEQSNVELERRVNEKALEIQAYHAERQEVLRQQLLTNERHRIIADMHDGLGASLVELLRHVQSTPTDHRGIEQHVKEALQEMRIAIDALEPAQGDLATVLGNLRYRLEPLMAAGGIRLAWDVAELPKVEALDPSAVFAIQRAVLEALFNALKHSGAREIRLAALPKDDGIEIRIEDDGRGFDINQPAAGLGLGTMRERTHRLGGSFDISSHRGAGTAITIRIPYALANAPDERHRVRIESNEDARSTSLAAVAT